MKTVKCSASSVFHVDTPDQVCEIIDALFTEIENFSIPNLCWRGKSEVIGGISVEAAAQHIYSNIAMGECVTFFNINDDMMLKKFEIFKNYRYIQVLLTHIVVF